jgi:hypothetical protein
LKEIQGLLANITKLNSFDRFGVVQDMIMSGRMIPSMFENFESEEDIGVWYMLYVYVKNDLMFAKYKIKMLGTYRE